MGMKFCHGCGKEIHESAPICPQCGAPQNETTSTTSDVIPDGIKGWSWGAFFLNWIWAIGNKTWIGLLALIPLVGFIMSIVLGIKGREWAWKNKQWDSVEHFNRTQKKWSVWGIGFATVIGILAAVAIPAYIDYQHKGLAAKDSQEQAKPQQGDQTLAEAIKAQQGTDQQLAEQSRGQANSPSTAAATPESTLPKLSAAAEKPVQEGFVESANPICNAINKQAEVEQAFLNPVSAYKIIGDGRLYFYDAPDDNCRLKDIFLVPGDQVSAVSEFKGWLAVTYVNPKSGKEFDGWLDSKRLKFNGTDGQKN